MSTEPATENQRYSHHDSLLYRDRRGASLTLYVKLTGQFYFGYIVAVLPMALLFTRLPLAKSAAVAVFIWGVICILSTVCTDYR